MDDNLYQHQPQNIPEPGLPQASSNFANDNNSVPGLDVSLPSYAAPALQGQISSLPPEANDIDLIEKEWVTHLKYIVSSTTGNPYLQQLEISKAKADYMRKRYNKDVKVAEG